MAIQNAFSPNKAVTTSTNTSALTWACPVKTSCKCVTLLLICVSYSPIDASQTYVNEILRMKISWMTRWLQNHKNYYHVYSTVLSASESFGFAFWYPLVCPQMCSILCNSICKPSAKVIRLRRRNACVTTTGVIYTRPEINARFVRILTWFNQY